jgi:hypothetical protein
MPVRMTEKEIVSREGVEMPEGMGGTSSAKPVARDIGR